MDEHVLSPLLSEADPAEPAEGAIDPLGLYQVADALAMRLVPDGRERQVRPRWLPESLANELRFRLEVGPSASGVRSNGDRSAGTAKRSHAPQRAKG